MCRVRGRLTALLWAVAFGKAYAQADTARFRETQLLFPGCAGKWAAARLKEMSLDAKIGQLIMTPAFTTKDRNNKKTIEKLVTRYRIGGIIFMQGGPQTQAQVTEHLQKISPIPLLVATDAEWGLNMRLDSVIRFPRNMLLGALYDDSLVYAFGRELARQCRLVGVHVNFAPVVDVNNNPVNPVINDRAFGEDLERVTRKSLALMRGLQDGGVIACAKHFPGHGDTDADSHYDLPVIPHNRRRLDSLELAPFRAHVQHGVQSIMVAHLFVPALDSTPGIPSTLSPKIVQGLLKDTMGFAGLVFTDALNMGAVTKNFKTGELAVKALLAGNDVLLYVEDVSGTIAAVKQAVVEGKIPVSEIDRRVYKILLAKEWLQLHLKKFRAPQDVVKKINDASALHLRRELYRQAQTLVKNDGQLLPFRDVENRRFAYVQIGADDQTCLPFIEALKKYREGDYFLFPKSATYLDADSFAAILAYEYTDIIVGVFGWSRFPNKNYGITHVSVDFVRRLCRYGGKTTVAVFGNPYLVRQFEAAAALLACYDQGPDGQQAAAEVIFGNHEPRGELPVSLSDSRFPPPAPYIYLGPRFGFAAPEERGMDSAILSKIDSIVHHYLKLKAMPGCAVVVAQGTDVVYDKIFGTLDYRKPIGTLNVVYDLASLTKVAATTLCAMKLYETGKFKLDRTVADYIPRAKGLYAGGLTMRELLTHKTGLPAWKPYWKDVAGNRTWLSDTLADDFVHLLHDSLYLHKHYPDTLFDKILREKPTGNRNVSVYSDLNFIILGKCLEQAAGTSLEWFVHDHFYGPLGMTRTAFNPKAKCMEWTFAPTAYDSAFRQCLLEGYVHDQNAALLGGYAGHAGLFSTPYDLLKLFMMLKNGGEYGGRCYLSPETIELFTQKADPSGRRGLGWDKPDKRPGFVSPVSAKASSRTYGHLGFTGTCVWIDPEYDLLYIFLSNRTFLNQDKSLFNTDSVRIKIMDVVYESLKTSVPTDLQE
jgi:beta-glucosidase-like glycosyl hydrolase/CubicO group peptidase (beta-lactamase class C family)